MMKMDTGEGFPLRQGDGTGSREVFGGSEACGSGTPDLSSVLEVLGYVGIYRRKKSVGRCSKGPQDKGACPVGGVPPIS